MLTLQKTRFAQNLKILRLRHNWTQSYIAEQIGTTTVNVSRWERGLLLPGLYFRQRLCDLFNTNTDALGLLMTDAASSSEQHATASQENARTEEAQSHHAPPVFSWHVPHARNPLFTGRDDVLSTLEETFFSPNQSSTCHVLALCGIGGIGKTQTALEYAYRHRHRYTAVFWIQAESGFTTIADIRSILSSSTVPDMHLHNETDSLRAFTSLLKTFPGWLLVLDNLADFNILEKIVTLDPVGHILLTTSSQVTGTLAQPVSLEKMTAEESILFLLRRAKLLSPQSTLSSAPDTLTHQATTIARFMDGLPLALDQAGAYIEEIGCDLHDYIALYEQQRTRLLERRGRFATGHPDSVAATILRAYEKVKQIDPMAADLLHACTLLYAEAVPAALFCSQEQRGSYYPSSNLHLASDKTSLHEAISTLRTYSLVTSHTSSQVPSLHPLVLEVLRSFVLEEHDRESEC
jgi:transcriptional regulator with XRE-family HTH domain